MKRAGVTLLEMLIVVTIVATIVSVSFPALTAGLAGIRLSSASGTVASFLTSTMNNVDRREQAAAILVEPKANVIEVFTAASGEKASETLKLPRGVAIEGDENRRFLLFPGGAFPRISISLKNEKGARKSIEIDPVTAVPKIR
jgi:prepilin-type N-terminal cleavage/methylation domain-containing protein